MPDAWISQRSYDVAPSTTRTDPFKLRQEFFRRSVLAEHTNSLLRKNIILPNLVTGGSRLHPPLCNIRNGFDPQVTLFYRLAIRLPWHTIDSLSAFSTTLPAFLPFLCETPELHITLRGEASQVAEAWGEYPITADRFRIIWWGVATPSQIRRSMLLFLVDTLYVVVHCPNLGQYRQYL